MSLFIKKNQLSLYIFIIGILCLLIGTSYAFFSADLLGIKENTIQIGNNLVFNYQEKSNNISLNGQDVLTDEQGMVSNKYFDFDVSLTTNTETTANYYIYLTADSTSNISDGSFIKVYLTDQNNNKILDSSTISNLKRHETYSNSYYLYGKSITSNNNIKTTDSYRLRIWIDEANVNAGIIESNGVHELQQQNISFKFKINVATGEIPATILSMYQSGDLSIGDFITYDAGVWTQAEINSIKVGPNSSLVSANNSTSKPSTHYQFGGFVEGQSRNVGAVESDTTYIYAKMYDDNDSTNQVALSGWRVFDIDEDNETVTLISAANPEDYFHSTYACISEYILTGQVNEDMCDPNEYNSDNYTIRDWSMYENSRYNASNARVITKTDLDNWYNKYMGVTNANTYTESTFQRIYSSPYLGYQNLIDNHTAYWLGSAIGATYLFLLSPSTRRVNINLDYAFGLRPLVSIPLTSIIQENPVARRTVTLDGMEWWDGTYGPESVQEYNVWDLAVE